MFRIDIGNSRATCEVTNQRPGDAQRGGQKGGTGGCLAINSDKRPPSPFLRHKDELEAEKRAMQRMWAKREKQLERAITQTAGMYGDLNGIIGASLPAIEKLEFPAIESSLHKESDSDSLNSKSQTVR